ncbi:MAG: extracellular solute-binding protein family 5, partial [Pseudonocardiales bacterium]|nr:extracellular solute-binding protein family 5 [Pseudonocardiales bacterium]
MRMRRVMTSGAVLAVAISLAACGGSSKSNSSPNPSGSSTGSAAAGKTGGTLKVVSGTAADSLDPGFGYTTQALEADNMVYLSLLGYANKEGTDGTALQPNLVEALPTVSADKLTYTMKLRSGLKYSDGTALKASDFTHAIERSIKISWGGSSFFTGYIKGASDYSKGKAAGISGITADDATGAITIVLTTPYGAFDNILAFPAAAPIPSTTPMKVLSNTPPVGIGPYK